MDPSIGSVRIMPRGLTRTTLGSSATHLLIPMKGSALAPVGGEGPLDVVPELRLPPDAAFEGGAIQDGAEPLGDLSNFRGSWILISSFRMIFYIFL